jgi:hypothetical protein
MFTAAECRVIANQKLAQAKHDDRHRRRLINSAEAWLFLASKLSGEVTGFSTDGNATESTRANFGHRHTIGKQRRLAPSPLSSSTTKNGVSSRGDPVKFVNLRRSN